MIDILKNINQGFYYDTFYKKGEGADFKKTGNEL